jgi:hypothetical protein
MSLDSLALVARVGAAFLLAFLFGAAPASAQTLSLTNATDYEGDSGSFQVTIQVELSAPSANPVSVRFATVDGNATAGSDYVAVDTTVTIPAGSLRKAVNITVNSDTASEPDEEFYINLSNPVNATIADSQGVVTILSDDTSLSVSDVTLVEGNGSSKYFSFKVSLSNRSTKTVTFDYATVEGTAVPGNSAGADFYPQSGENYAFFPGEIEKYFNVSVYGDSVVEGDETFQFNVSNVANATVVDGNAVGTILNDDAGSPTLSVNSATLTEGNSGTKNATFTVQLSSPQAGPVSFDIATANGTATAGSDYVAKSQAGVQIPAGATTQAFSVVVNGDTTYESDETFGVSLSNPIGAVLGYPNGTGKILNDDPIPLTISVDDFLFGEGSDGNYNVPVVVKLSTAAAVDVLFDVATANGTATAGSDYQAVSLTDQVIPAGATSMVFYVVVNGDRIDESDETFEVHLSNVRNAPAPSGFATATIWDDDTGVAVPSISIADVSITEGNSSSQNATFTVQLSEPSASPVSFDIATSNGTATAGSDYVASSLAGQAIAAGQTSKTFSVTINGDTSVEPDEYFTVTLANVNGATVADDQAWGTIVNDDAEAPPSITINDGALTETDVGNGSMEFHIQLSEFAVAPVTFNVQVVDGSAVAGVDYIAPASPVTIPAGSNGINIHATVIGDNLVEGHETFNVKLQDVVGATVADAEAIGTIYNDDQPQEDFPTMRLEDAYVTEGQSGTKNAAITVRLSRPASSDVWFSYALEDGTAIAGSDYQSPVDKQVFIAPGVTVQTFNIPIVGDTLVEPNETFVVKFWSSQGAYRGDEDAVVTIVNDEGGSVPPMLSVVDAFTVSEGNAGTQSVVFNVNLSEASASAVSFDIATADGAATAGSDYVASSTTGLTIPAGTKSATFAVTVNGDTAAEGDEHFFVNLSNAQGATIVDNQAIGMIANDDNAGGSPTLSIANASVSEGNSGTKQLDFTVSLSAPAAGTVTYSIATADGSATAGSDYVASSLIGQSIPAGTTSKAFSITINGDTNAESDEFFRVNLSNVSGAALGTNESEVTILNDDGATPTLSVNDVAVVEGNSGTKIATFTVTLSVPQSGPVFFDVATADLTAQAGSDYVAKALTGVRIAAGATSKTFTVTVNGDTSVEYGELFFVNLANPVGAVIGDGQGVGTIANDDEAVTPTLSIGDVSVSEGNSGTKLATFTVSLSAAATGEVSYDIATTDGSAESINDFVAAALSNQSIPVGQTSKAFSVTINGDTEVEADETFLVAVTNVFGATVADSTATGTITNDDSAGVPALSIGDVSISEGNSGTKTANFTVSLSAPAAANVFFDVATSDGTASGNVDYMASFPTGVMIAAGQSSTTVPITINGDTTVEPNETFNVTVSNVSNATVADGTATGTITNDDTAGGPTLSIADLSITEGNGTSKQATFTVSLSAAASTAVTYNVATANGTAVAPSDYVAKALNGQSIPAGSLSKSFTVNIKGGTVSEPDETFTVNLTNVAGATLADGQAVGIILNDDAAVTPTLSIADASVSEGNSGTKTLTFTVSLSPAAAATVSYNIATSNGTATAGSDYVAASLVGQTIAAGGTSKTFAVTLNGDTTTESDETFTVTLSNVVGASLGDGTATGTITNDDGGGGGPTLSIGDVSLAEGNGFSKQMTFTVTLSAPATGPVTYSIATANGTAVAPSDYTTKSLTGQSIAAGTTSKVFTVVIKGGTVVEPDETFTVNVSAVTGATLADGQATGTIVNDDAATITVARFDARGLVDDIDDGNREPVLTAREYASLLLDTATQLCARTYAATIVGVEGVEHRAVLADLAETANATCANSRYAAVMADTAGEGTGFLVEPTSDADARGAQVLGKPTLDALQVQASGHASPIAVLLPKALSTKPTERKAQLRALGQQIDAMLTADPQARIVLIGGVTVPGLLDLTARAVPAKDALPAERVLVSPALLQEFGKSRVEFPLVTATQTPAQVLQLQQ